VATTAVYLFLMTPGASDDNKGDAFTPEATGEWYSAQSAPISRRAADILDSLSDSVSAFDPSWRWVYLNPAARDTLTALGRDPDTVIGKILWDELPMLLDTRFEIETRRAVTEQRVVEYEEYLPDLDRWYEMRVVPNRGLITTHTRDVTERRRAERAIEQSADRAVRLLSLATRLGKAETPQDVVDAALREALDATGARAGSVSLLRVDTSNDKTFEIVATAGYGAALERRFRRFPFEAGRPVSDAVIAGALVVIASKAEWDTRYGRTGVSSAELPGEAMATIPIMVDGSPVAALSLTFREPQKFDDVSLHHRRADGHRARPRARVRAGAAGPRGQRFSLRCGSGSRVEAGLRGDASHACFSGGAALGRLVRGRYSRRSGFGRVASPH
jgi:PAS domain-containing protein